MPRFALAGAILVAVPTLAAGQVTTTNFGCSQVYSVSPPAGQQWNSVLARQFAHSWYTSSAGSGWQVRPGSGPGDPPQQSGAFAFTGVDTFVSGTIYNSCVYPCTPPRTGDIARTKDTPISTAGTATGGIVLPAQVPAPISNSALSRVEVSPYAPTGPVSMTLSAQGQYQTVNSPPVVTGYSKAYAFSQADLRSSVIPPSLPGGMLIATSWSLGVVQASRVTQGIVLPPPSPPTVRLWDPVRFVAENTLTGEQTRGEIFSMMLDLDGEGEARFTPAVGLWIDATEATFEMSCGGEFVKPEGRLRIRVTRGAVVEAFATGAFGAATMPPIGASTPVHVGDIPVGLTLLLDLGGVIPDPYVVTISADHAGMNPTQIPCPADVNFDGVVDFNDFLEFLNYFNEGSPLADLNHDGVIDFNDLLEFLNAFNWPC